MEEMKYAPIHTFALISQRQFHDHGPCMFNTTTLGYFTFLKHKDSFGKENFQKNINSLHLIGHCTQTFPYKFHILN